MSCYGFWSADSLERLSRKTPTAASCGCDINTIAAQLVAMSDGLLTIKDGKLTLNTGRGLVLRDGKLTVDETALSVASGVSADVDNILSLGSDNKPYLPGNLGKL